jgi:hypothetical protein
VFVNVVEYVIFYSTCLGLHLSALSISVSSLLITNSTCCDTDNYIVLLHFNHLSAVIYVFALCCLIVLIFFVLRAFVVAFVFSYLIVLTMASRLHTLPLTLSLFTIYMSLLIHLDVII